MKTIVKLAQKRLWIPAIGFSLVFGLINCCIMTIFFDIEVDWASLITSLSLLVGISGTRDVVLKNIKSAVTVVEDSIPTLKINAKRLWIPCFGWVLAIGFFICYVLVPWFEKLEPANLSQMNTALAIMLAISGARDVGLKVGKKSSKKESTETENEEEA